MLESIFIKVIAYNLVLNNLGVCKYYKCLRYCNLQEFVNGIAKFRAVEIQSRYKLTKWIRLY